MNKATTSTLTASVMVALAPLCWAGDIVLARGLAGTVPPFSLAFWRWALAFLILLPFSWKTTLKDLPSVKGAWGNISFLSALGVSGFIALLYVGVKSTTAMNSALIQTTLPAIIVILCLLIYGKKVSIKQMFGICLCLGGACHVVVQGSWCNLTNIAFVKGDFYILIAAVLYGLYSALLPKSPKIHPSSFLTLTAGIGAFTLLPFYMWELTTAGTFMPSQSNLLAILYVAIFPSIVAYICWQKGVETIGPSNTGMFITLVPVFVAILSVPFLKETLMLCHLVGMIMIFTGMIMFNMEDRNSGLVKQ